MTHLAGAFRVVVLVGCVLASLAALGGASGARAANPWEIEAGEGATSPAAFVTVSFATAFAQTPVVVVLPTDENPDPAALRIRNVTATGFEVALVEPSGNDGAVAASGFHYIAATPGLHVMPSGEPVFVGTLTTSAVQLGAGVAGTASWETVTFPTTFPSAAAVLATIQSDNSEVNAPPAEVSVPWLAVAMRNPTTTTVQLALERAEAAPGAVAAEVIGYIALPGGSGGSFLDDGGAPVDWRAVISGDTIRGFNNGCFTTTFSPAAFAAPRVVASQTRRDGNNGGWARRCSLSGTAIGLTIDEDQFRDPERNHTTEAASIVAFSRGFHAVLEGRLAAIKSVDVVEDPVNGPGGPYAIPGARVRYTVDVQSIGQIPIDGDTVDFVDALPAEISLVVSDFGGPGSGPVEFIDGTTTSALTYTFISLASTADDLSFSNDGGLTFTYTPSPGADGADPGVTHIRVQPKGQFAGEAAAAVTPGFSLRFDAVVK